MHAIDLHRHLEGSIRPSTALSLARAHRHWLADEPEPRQRVVAPERTAGLLDYLARIDVACSVASELEDWALITRQAVEDCYDDGLHYVELRFSPWFVGAQTGLDPRAVIDVVAASAATASAEYALPVGLIGILLRDLGPEAGERQLDDIVSRRGAFCGVDLAGDEAGYPADRFAATFARAREDGLHVTIHAGEAAGPESVWATLTNLRPERIGHGVRSVEDPALVDRLAADGVTLEVAPTSNVQTRAVPSIAEHPVRRLLDAGVRVCLNTDNPTPSCTRVSAEHRRAATECGLDTERLERTARYAAEAAFTADGRWLGSPAGEDRVAAVPHG